jgi:hypothetical protein
VGEATGGVPDREVDELEFEQENDLDGWPMYDPFQPPHEHRSEYTVNEARKVGLADSRRFTRLDRLDRTARFQARTREAR